MSILSSVCMVRYYYFLMHVSSQGLICKPQRWEGEKQQEKKGLRKEGGEGERRRVRKEGRREVNFLSQCDHWGTGGFSPLFVLFLWRRRHTHQGDFKQKQLTAPLSPILWEQFSYFEKHFYLALQLFFFFYVYLRI